MEAPLVVGRYRIYEPIAAGGMATVHFARLIGEVGFARTVAIKRLHPKRWGESQMVASLVDEARLASRIKHPNVVPTLDVFVSNGELFVVMEYVMGETFARLLRGFLERAEPVPVPIALGVAVGMLHGLHAAHQAKSELGKPLQIVHRDVSPQNVIVGTDGLVRVLDFGVAKATDRLSNTSTGQIKGKIRYMAPEQVRADAVSPATDVFAAGIVLWEALAGRRLHKTEADVAKAYAFKEAPPRLCDVNPAVSGPLSAAVHRAMELVPADRYPDALSFANALEDLADVAPPRRLAEWVATLAAASLLQREERLAEIERDSALRPTPRAGAEDETETDVSSAKLITGLDEAALDGGLTSTATTRPTHVGPLALEPTSPTSAGVEPDGTSARMALSAGIVSGPASAARTSLDGHPRRPRWRRVWVFAFAALAGSALGGLVLRARTDAPSAGTRAPSSVEGPPPAASAPTEPTTATAAVSLPQPSAASVEETSATATAAPTERPRDARVHPIGPRGPASAGAPAPPATAKPADCNPPYTVDAQGVRRFKTECL